MGPLLQICRRSCQSCQQDAKSRLHYWRAAFLGATMSSCALITKITVLLLAAKQHLLTNSSSSGNFSGFWPGPLELSASMALFLAPPSLPSSQAQPQISASSKHSAQLGQLEKLQLTTANLWSGSKPFCFNTPPTFTIPLLPSSPQCVDTAFHRRALAHHHLTFRS